MNGAARGQTSGNSCYCSVAPLTKGLDALDEPISSCHMPHTRRWQTLYDIYTTFAGPNHPNEGKGGQASYESQECVWVCALRQVPITFRDNCEVAPVLNGNDERHRVSMGCHIVVLNSRQAEMMTTPGARQLAAGMRQALGCRRCA